MFTALYLACALLFLFGFSYFSGASSSTFDFVYLQYASLLLSFACLLFAFYDYKARLPRKLTKQDRQDEREHLRNERADKRKARREKLRGRING